VAEARNEAEAEAARQVDAAVEEQLAALRAQYGAVPAGAEEQVRTEAEAQAAARIEEQVPGLPEGIGEDGSGDAGGRGELPRAPGG
jgi:hypothetical protein